MCALIVANAVPQVLWGHTQHVEEGYGKQEEADDERAGKAAKAVKQIAKGAANKTAAGHFCAVAHQSLCGKVTLANGEHCQAEDVNNSRESNDKGQGSNDLCGCNLVIDISLPVNAHNQKQGREREYGRAKEAKETVANVVANGSHPVLCRICEAVLPVTKNVEQKRNAHKQSKRIKDVGQNLMNRLCGARRLQVDLSVLFLVLFIVFDGSRTTLLRNFVLCLFGSGARALLFLGRIRGCLFGGRLLYRHRFLRLCSRSAAPIAHRLRRGSLARRSLYLICILHYAKGLIISRCFLFCGSGKGLFLFTVWCLIGHSFRVLSAISKSKY